MSDDTGGAIPLSEMVCWNLYQASRTVTAEYRRLLEPIGLSYPQYIALACLWEYGDHTVGGLAERLKVEYGTITPLLKRLEHQGLVKRTRSATDERTVVVTLTDEGDALRRHAPDVYAGIVEAFGFTPERSAESLAVLRQIAGRGTPTS
ncbi:MarR family winged helix-turn-helix transcriptional regulator [Protaetiibacter intestinalis]|uniref:MarR family transcriptional regulator n=1 Tax=Protaetiibacter intestinalis TaxID=2419774 RepID=A0A387B7V2_9MICO|nr:MarR family winged helix-turn-helix transcriptional regulator [Protaetiibacter intestinalis]AYF97176.1 MarR family transcriptional regulator [Protaetiibacter intestinalis]